MTYFLLYLTIGAFTFWPMLHLDRECREYVLSGGWKSIAVAWFVWCFAWAFSLAVDAMFWVFKEPEE